MSYPLFLQVENSSSLIHNHCHSFIFSSSFLYCVVVLQALFNAVWSSRKTTMDSGWQSVETIQSSYSLSKKARHLKKNSFVSGHDCIFPLIFALSRQRQGYLWFLRQPDIHSEFQTSPGCIVRRCLISKTQFCHLKSKQGSITKLKWCLLLRVDLYRLQDVDLCAIFVCGVIELICLGWLYRKKTVLL